MMQFTTTTILISVRFTVCFNILKCTDIRKNEFLTFCIFKCEKMVGNTAFLV